MAVNVIAVVKSSVRTS